VAHRQFDLAEVEALRQAFEETHNVSSAISMARERGSGPSSPTRLRSALRRFEEIEADRILEESLAVRSVERTVEEVLLPAVDAFAVPDGGLPSAELGFAWRWATGWLAAAKRVAPAASRPEGVLIFDASVPCDIDALHAQALELCLRRAGMRTLMLTAELRAVCRTTCTRSTRGSSSSPGGGRGSTRWGASPTRPGACPRTSRSSTSAGRSKRPTPQRSRAWARARSAPAICCSLA